MNANLAILKTYRTRKKLLRQSPKQHYITYYGLLRSFIRRHYQRTTYTEAVSIANEAYVTALHTYDPTKGEFSTHLYYALKGAFRTRYEPQFVELDMCEPVTTNSPLSQLLFNEMISTLSTEAQEVVNTVLNTPIELIELTREVCCTNYHITKNMLRKYLYKHLGWSHPKIDQIINEIKQVLA